MSTLYKPILLFLLLFAWLVFSPFQTVIAKQDFVSPTPTYDPLAEPPLPPNPTEFELGQNLYWHWCMPCHGDRGQGLTDEFRGIWEPEHQNCWARGCHTGRKEDTGFPIPTVVPAVVNDSHLAQFVSVQELSDYLQATHPPQSPGILKREEYHAIALFVFTMNERPLAVILSTATPASIPTETLIPLQESTTSPDRFPVNAIVISGIIIVVVLILIGRARIQEKKRSV